MASILNLPPKTNAGLPRVDGPLKVSGVAYKVYVAPWTSPACYTRSWSCATGFRQRHYRRERYQPAPSSMPQRPRSVYTAVRTWAGSSAPRLRRAFPGSLTSAALLLRTTPSVTTDNTSPLWWHLRLNKPWPPPMPSR